MKNRTAWGVAVVLAVLLLGGGGVLIHRTYGFTTFQTQVSVAFSQVHAMPIGGRGTPVKLHGVQIGHTTLLWWRRADPSKPPDDQETAPGENSD
jgi:ABC-type transporter Mla subunit MlaD